MWKNFNQSFAVGLGWGLSIVGSLTLLLIIIEIIMRFEMFEYVADVIWRLVN